MLVSKRSNIRKNGIYKIAALAGIAVVGVGAALAALFRRRGDDDFADVDDPCVGCPGCLRHAGGASNAANMGNEKGTANEGGSKWGPDPCRCGTECATEDAGPCPCDSCEGCDGVCEGCDCDVCVDGNCPKMDADGRMEPDEEDSELAEATAEPMTGAVDWDAAFPACDEEGYF